jgi:hypothetical protein
MTEPQTCYMCDQISTSREHVPPRCLFPEAKDVQGQFREDLITVPSCEDHNSSKSSDDEFLLVSLAGIVGNNSVGYLHKFTKVDRAIYRSSFALLEQAMSNPRVEAIEFGPNEFIDVIWGTPDYERLTACFDRIARGLHLAYFGRKFSGSTKTLLGYTRNAEANPAEFQRFIRDKVDLELNGKPRLGANPDVFTFQFTNADQFGLYLVHLQFYGRLDVFVALIPDSSPPLENLAMRLIEKAIPTVITLGEKEYHFNVEQSGDGRVR